MNSTVLPCFQFGMNFQGFAVARLTLPAYVDGRKLENSSVCKDRILLHRHVDIPYSLVVTYNLTLDGKLCIRDDKNASFVYLHHLLPWEASLVNVTMCVRINRKPFLIG